MKEEPISKAMQGFSHAVKTRGSIEFFKKKAGVALTCVFVDGTAGYGVVTLIRGRNKGRNELENHSPTAKNMRIVER